MESLKSLLKLALLSEQSARSNEQGTYGSDRDWLELAHSQGRDEADVCGECRDNEQIRSICESARLITSGSALCYVIM